MEPGGRVIRGKLRIPPVQDSVIDRSRVVRRIEELIATRRVTLVVATAGSGKTTAVVQTVRRSTRPVAWLTLDPIDTAAGRFLTYLETAVSEHVPEASGVATAALAAGLPHREAAGLLAEALADADLLIVFDGLENLCEGDGVHALATLSTFIQYTTATVRIVGLSRVAVPLDVGGLSQLQSFAEVGEAELAFTPDEAGDALARAGKPDTQVADVVEATGGWVTGVLFEAWRSESHVMGAGGEADPLHGYLATQILDKLTASERELLIVSSLLDEVTAARARALGIPNAGEILASLRVKHLPVTWLDAPPSMRCHPRFRDYLVALFNRRGEDVIRAARTAHGRLLVSEGRHEEAVEEFLAVGAYDEATEAAEVAVAAVVERLDLEVVDRWLATLAGQRARVSIRLAAAEIASAVARENFARAVEVADRLLAEDARERLATSNPTAGAMMVWAYWHLARVDDARTVLWACPTNPSVEAVRYLMDLLEVGPEGPVAGPPLTGGPLDALVKRVHYARGRLSEVLDAPPTPWAASVSAPWRMGALRAMGRLAEAAELLSSHGEDGWAVAWRRGVVAPELLIDLKRDDARQVLLQGRQDIRSSGSLVFLWLSWLIEAKLELRLNGDAEAASACLDRAEAGGARRYAFIGELIDTWRGYVYLLLDRNEEARSALLSAITTMRSCERSLEVPTAAVYLAEAEWRLGAQAAADEWADEALRAADEQGSNHQLITALADCPGVVSRRLDSEPENDSRWHAVGRILATLRGDDVADQAPLRLHLREFGDVQMLVNDEQVKPRIAKSLLLLAYLAQSPQHQATREELMSVLFDDRDDESTRSYLRQAVHRLRELLPEGTGPAFDGRYLRFTARVVCTSDSVVLERRLAEASRLQGAHQVRALNAALAVPQRGAYLTSMSGDWIEERRRHIDELVSRANLQLARAHYADEQFVEAERCAERSLAGDPYQESAWRLLMQIGNALGDEDRVILTFRRCQAALEELGAEPSDYTRRLLDQLRR